MADSSTNYIYTIGSYATLLGVGYAIYHVSTQRPNKRAAPVTRGVKNVQPEPRKEDRKKKQRLESFAAEAQGASSKAPKAKPEFEQTEKPTPSRTGQDTSPDDGVDNREFARQLAKAKEGTKFATKTDGGKKREKSVKQSRANKIGHPEQQKPSPPSSHTGAEADDDQSPVTSPEAKPADASGVADMLEPLPAGPSVLRFTDTSEKKAKQKKPQAFEQAETKKQRQNRKKVEAAREVKLEQEKERKALEEKQRRTARIAEGRAAKDGSQFVAAAKKTSSWTQGAPKNDGPAPAPTNGHHELLDTFDAPIAEKKAAKVAQPSASSKAWISSLPSEEEQMELLKNDEDDWNTVKPKSKKGTKKAASSTESGDEHVKPSSQTVAAELVSAPVRPAPAPKSSQNFGSFSALTKDEPAEEVEEEWDV